MGKPRPTAPPRRSAQETVFHGAQLQAPVVLAAVELGFAVHRGQRVAVVVPSIDPFVGDDAKPFRAIQFGDIDKAARASNSTGVSIDATAHGPDRWARARAQGVV